MENEPAQAVPPDDENNNQTAVDQAAIDRETDEMYNRIFKLDPESQARKAELKVERKSGLADELGIEDIYQPLVGGHGKLFCAAGKDAPLVVFEEDFLVLHPPQKPLMDEAEPVEEMVIQVNERGLLLNELGEVKKINSARYKGRPIFISGEQRDDTTKHFVVVEDYDGSLHFIFNDDLDGERITADECYRFRNTTHDGELTKFGQLSSTLDEAEEEN